MTQNIDGLHVLGFAVQQKVGSRNTCNVLTCSSDGFIGLGKTPSSEYNIDVHFEGTSLYTARWVETDDAVLLKKFLNANQGALAEDHNGSPVFLARNAWHLKKTTEDWPAVRFLKTTEQVQ